jgi:hypothetical protein
MKDLINQTNGKIFSIEFNTVKGEYRKMTVRTNVKKGVNGKGLRYSPEDKGLICLYKMGIDKGFRMIKIENIISLKINGQIYKK